jgi:hypothetical protein
MKPITSGPGSDLRGTGGCALDVRGGRVYYQDVHLVGKGDRRLTSLHAAGRSIRPT